MESLKLYFQHAPDSHRVILTLICVLLFWNLERIAGLSRNYRKWPHAIFNSSFLFITLPVQALFSFVSVQAYHYTETHPHQGWLHLIPGINNAWVEFLVTFLAFDFIEYVYHVIMHKNKMLWLFHVVHHSDTEVDISTTFREHPLESIFRMVFLVLNILLAGASMWTILFRQFIQVAATAFSHTRFRFAPRVDRYLSLIFVTPNVHHVHHHDTQPYTDSNYGDVLSIWDRIFGTYRTLPDIHFGIDNYITPEKSKRYFFLLRFPFLHRLGRKGLPLLLFLSLFCSNMLLAQSGAEADRLLGNWISPKKDLIIQCFKKGQVYYAKVLWFKKYEDGTHDAELTRKENAWLNTIVVSDMTFGGEKWSGGTIKDLKSGKTYSANIHLLGNDKVEVRGYILLPIFGESMLFSRYTPAQLPVFDYSFAPARASSKLCLN